MSDQKTPRAAKLVAQYKNVFQSPDGRAVLLNLMRANFVLSSTVVDSNTNLTLVHEGQRNAILRILTILKMDPEKLLRTIEEEEERHA